MNLYNKLSLAWSYFVKHIRRFAFLLVALGLGFGVITIMTSLSQGMTKNLYSAALNHYGGELFIIGYDQDHRNRMHMNQIPRIEAILEQWDYPMVQLIPRINYFGDGKLYFAGNSSMQKNVLGINWQDEAFNLNDLNIQEGSLEDIREPQSIVISSQTAQQLKCRLGDDIILRVDTLQGQANTGHFIVRAIFKDPGLLGSYKSFIDLGEFQGLLNYGPEDISSLGIRFKKPPEVEELFKLYQILQEALPMAPFMETKEQLTHNIERQSWSGIRYFLIPLSLYVSQVDDLLKSMDILAYFLYLMISLIILVSIAVTYRLVIKDRTPEIGTMRALGMQKKDLTSLLLWESLFLFILSLFLGAVFAGIVLFILSRIPFSTIPGFELFMKKGRLIPQFSFFSSLMNIMLLLIITLPAVYFPARRASVMDLPHSLSGDN